MRSISSSLGLLAITAALLGSCPLYAQVSMEEREALIRFYNATGGENWTESQNWLSEPGTECDWFGVQCANPQSEPPFVLRLSFVDNNLVGTLPISLSELDRLETLAVRGSSLSGTIPADLWGLEALTSLALIDNELVGTIPASILGLREGAPATRITLSGNRLTGFEAGPVPETIQSYEIELNLDDNLIDQLPPESWRSTTAIQSLSMANNRIERVEISSPWIGLEHLDLSGNAIRSVSAPEGEPLPQLERLDLARNGLDTWPNLIPDLASLTSLDLSDNALSDDLPTWFSELELADIDLDNNQLTGSIDSAFQGLDFETYPRPGPHGTLGLRLHVANNSFSGPLPDVDFSSFNTPFEGQAREFGLDLCFNDIDMPQQMVLEEIAPVHRGMNLSSCIGQSQISLTPDISGSWYQPERSGEGTTLMLLENGQILQYWFTYAPDGEVETSQQQWFVGVTEPASTWAEFRPLVTTSGGRFQMGLGDGEVRESGTWLRQNRTGEDALHFFYDYRSGGFCITGACFWDIHTDRFEQTRLSQLAGTRCDLQSPFQQYAGAWYSPERSGEGFVVEVLPENRRVTVYWFTHKPDESGEQAWMIGDGQFQNSELVGDPPPPYEERADVTLYQPQGAYFGSNFESSDVQVDEWGTLRFEFNDANSGRVYWDSEYDDYGSGDYEIERLAQPMLADCD